jgi:hypothetical protein
MRRAMRALVRPDYYPGRSQSRWRRVFWNYSPLLWLAGVAVLWILEPGARLLWVVIWIAIMLYKIADLRHDRNEDDDGGGNGR